MGKHSSVSISQTRMVSAVFLFYTTLLGLTCCLKLETFQYTDFDLAAHTQSLHNLLRGSLDCSILGVPFPGNHMALSLLLVAPVYALFPSPATLLLFQTITLAMGCIAVFLYGRRHLPAPYPAIVASLYLLYTPLIYMNLYEFHPVALATTFLLFSLLAYDTRQPRVYALFLLLSMTCQENIALVAIMLGIKALLDRRSWGWSVGPIVAGAAWFSACIFLIMPHFNPGIIRFESIYGDFGDSLPAIAANILKHPVSTLSSIMVPSKMLFMGAIFLPLALISFLAPTYLIAALPIIAQRLLSGRESETTLLYHYQAELIPFVFVAAIHGLHRLERFKSIRWQHIAVTCMVAMTILALDITNVPTAITVAVQQARDNRIQNHTRRQIVKSIPKDANITATFRYLPKLANRRNLHSFHHVYTGFYTLSTTPYPTPKDQDFVLLDTDDPRTFSKNGFYTPGGETNLEHLIESNDMRLALKTASTILFVRKYGHN